MPTINVSLMVILHASQLPLTTSVFLHASQLPLTTSEFLHASQLLLTTSVCLGPAGARRGCVGHDQLQQEGARHSSVSAARLHDTL